MIYTVTFNPSLDYIVDVDNFSMGKVNRTAKEQIYPGGKGINVSLVLKNLGLDSRILGFTAGFTGEEIKRSLKEAGCVTDFINIGKGMSRINIKLRSGEESEINGQGPDIGEKEVSRLMEKLKGLEREDMLVLSGSIPSKMKPTVYEEILEQVLFQDVKIVVDATGELLRSVLKYHPFMVKPNNHELEEFFSVKIESKDEIIRYGKELQKMGATNVLVSMAGDGGVLVTEKGEVYLCEAPHGKLINSVGAGDSMVAGFIAGYLKHENYEEAFRMGVAAGSASAFSQWLAGKEAVDRLLKDVILQKRQ